MHRSSKSITWRYELYLFLGICVVLLLALFAALRFATPLNSFFNTEVKTLNTGWQQEEDGTLMPIPVLPCSIPAEGNVIRLVHEGLDLPKDLDNALVFRTRYASIRVWADHQLVYEAAQGKEHALGSMWHFVPWSVCESASSIQVELTRYEDAAAWDLSPVYFDHPQSIHIHLVYENLTAILFWLFTLLFTLLLLFIALFMAYQKVERVMAMLSLAAFIFLSGQWILLDSKITTLLGGNYAITYFFSYAAFYLLLAPYLEYIQLMLNSKSKALRWLTVAVVCNAAFCMLLHLIGAVSIRYTAFTVHILIFFSIVVTTRIFWHSVVKRRERNLRWTFLGMLLIYTAGAVSIVLYYAGHLPAANSTGLFAWGLLILTLCMTLDAIFFFSHLVKQKQYMDRYRQLATQDSMTMLGNRNAFEGYLQELALSPPAQLIFIMFDMDGLKQINDTYGHHVGDQAIYLTAQYLREIFEPYGKCFRIGGDEFSVIIPAPCQVEELLKEYKRILNRYSNAQFPGRISYGWAQQKFSPGKTVDVEEIVGLHTRADQMMYENKKYRKASDG